MSNEPFPVSTYFSVWQLRADGWAWLEGATKRLVELAETNPEHGDLKSLAQDVGSLLDVLEPIERYWAFPGRLEFTRLRRLLDHRERDQLSKAVARIDWTLVNDFHQPGAGATSGDDENGEEPTVEAPALVSRHRRRPHFEVLVVDDDLRWSQDAVRDNVSRLRRPDDEFTYDLVVVSSFEEALVAVLLNVNLQACVVGSGFTLRSRHELSVLRQFLTGLEDDGLDDLSMTARALRLGAKIKALRPELDLYLLAPVSVEEIAGRPNHDFRRVFHSQDDYLELHQSILRGVGGRYRTPFFTALKEYSQRPVGVFHALPISRGNSVVKSPWIHDMADFYGLNLLLAETSATSGGLDSLLEPTGAIKEAMDLAARAFGAHRSFFVTNGTSTANKIVVQALGRPGDIVLVDRSCHKSHHYGLVVDGAQVAYLDAYPIGPYSICGAVPLREIKRALLAYRRDGKLDQVKLLMLTNCTFDGIVYDVERVMEECLAIKPDLVFLWDEAWFAFAGFHPTYRRRTAMAAAERLRERYRAPAYRELYAAFRQAMGTLDSEPDDRLLETRLLPDPEQVRVRVYATQSTHKTLTALRQGSMIHVFDQDFGLKVEDSFHEAYMTHTSTSPNYQILASLDIGRRQVELEGFKLVQKQVELSMMLWEHVEKHPLIRKYFRFLTTQDLIPTEYRQSGSQLPLAAGWAEMDRAWSQDEFVLDPTRLHLLVAAAGIDGDTFKRRYLMDRYGIQVNKTSRNTVLFMTNIGTTRSAVAYLIEVLASLAREFDEEHEGMSLVQRRLHERSVSSLTRALAPPPFSAFHPAFRAETEPATREGDLRKAFYLAHDERTCESLVLEVARERVQAGRAPVSATFVTPYPPGFPLLVPGQIIDDQTLSYLEALDTPEIHGYRALEGLRVFTEEALAAEPPVLVEEPVGSQRLVRVGAARQARGEAEGRLMTRRDDMTERDDTTGGGDQ